MINHEPFYGFISAKIKKVTKMDKKNMPHTSAACQVIPVGFKPTTFRTGI